MKSFTVVLALAVLSMVCPALALTRAPQPARPVAMSMYSGRWYQIGQIAKTNRHPCPGAIDDFSTNSRGGFSVVETCRDASSPGGVRQIRAKVKIVAGSGNARFKMSFLAGLISQEYWVLDHAADQSWALMATPGGNYLWLLARRPNLDPVALAAARARITALGYDAAKLTSTR